MLPLDSESDSISSRLTELLQAWRYPLLLLFVGLILLAGVILFAKGFFNRESGKVEVIEATSAGTLVQKNIVVEVVGAVENPGVYELETGSRIEEALQKAGGVTPNADYEWMSKFLNRAAKVTDGQKIYIPNANTVTISEQKQQEVLSANNLTPIETQSVSRTIITENVKSGVNINTASTTDLDKLPGIGPVYAQKIVDHRPYSTVDELLTKKVIPAKTFEKIKGEIRVY
jgi:competence protein ComEA